MNTEKMIKIAYVFTPIEFGGAEKVNLTFLRNVDRTRFEIQPIVLIRPWEENNVVNELEKEKYIIHKIPVAIRPRNSGRDYIRIIRCFRMLKNSILTSNFFDLVHSHGYFADIIGVSAAKVLKIPHISTCHGFISNDRNLALYNSIDRLLLCFSDKIIAVSEQIKDDLERSGIIKSKISVIQNAVQTIHKAENYEENRRKKRLALAIKDEEFIVGYVGRLSDEKGVQYLIEAGMLLMETGMPCKILIIGDGPKRKELEDMVKMKGLEDNIIFTGFQTNIEEWMSLLDIFVLPSLTEGTPMALLEAMAFGLPVVASDVGGIPEIIDSGENGILVPAANPDKIEEAISTICKDNYFRTKLSEMAKKTIRSKFNINEWVNKIESVYVETIGKRKSWVEN